MKLEPYTEELRGCPVKGNAYPVLVLGIGNPLMGDDGAGVELAHRLQERDYGPLVHVEEGGTQGMTLLPLLEDADTLILLDAVRTGALPGTVVTRSREELPRHFSRVMSPHQIGMKEVLGAAQLCGTLPRAITLVGVEALHTDFCRPMSAEVQEALPKALDTAEALIARALAEHQARKTPMHEVGIMEGALDMARRLMEKRGGNRLRRVHMTIGSLSGVVPEALQSAFLALKDSYAAQDAALDVAWVEAVCRCDACRADFSFTEHGYICPGCGEPALAILRGRELELTRVEWE